MDKYRFYFRGQKIGLERVKEREIGNDVHISGLYNCTDGCNVISEIEKNRNACLGKETKNLFWSYRRRYPRHMKKSYPVDC